MDVCRLCLSKENLSSVFDHEGMPSHVKACVSIEIRENDTLPTSVCTACIERVKDWSEFRETCLKTHQTLLHNQEDTKRGIVQVEDKNEDIQILKDWLKLEEEEVSCSDLDLDDGTDEDEALNRCEDNTEELKGDKARLYQCGLCEKSFEYCFDYLDHQQVHEGKPVFKCDKCTKVMGSDGDDHQCTPPEISESAKLCSKKLLPYKSHGRYELSYKKFMKWRQAQAHEIRTSFSETAIMAYFEELAKMSAPNTLWAHYSMLRTTLSIHHDVEISKYLKLKASLKRKSDGYRPRKSKTLTTQEIYKFLDNAPDHSYLFLKVALIMGISGACRKHELCHLTIDDIKDLGYAAVIHINDPKTKVPPRTFTLTGKFYGIYKKYALLRPDNVNERRFFLNYQNKKCTRQPIGINKIGAVPKDIAVYLKLENPKLYTGHCFRRSSILVDGSGNNTTLKRQAGWESVAVAEGYVNDSSEMEQEIGHGHAIEEAIDGMEKSSTVTRNDAEIKPFVDSFQEHTLHASAHSINFVNCSGISEVTDNFLR